MTDGTDLPAIRDVLDAAEERFASRAYIRPVPSDTDDPAGNLLTPTGEDDTVPLSWILGVYLAAAACGVLIGAVIARWTDRRSRPRTPTPSTS